MLRKFIRRALPGALAIGLGAGVFLAAQPPAVTATGRADAASGLRFGELPIALPPGLPSHPIRQVNPAYRRIAAWISSVGAAVAINDLTGNGVPDDMCLVDTRSNAVIVTPVPGSRAVGTYRPFVLDPRPALPYDPRRMAPMGCVPGDFNQDGRMDLLAYYWGRTPVIFQLRAAATALSPAAYRPVEVIRPRSPGAGYRGPLWNTNAVAVSDFDGDGHPDLFVGNYFPDSHVLDAHGPDDVVMQQSMSHAANAGGGYILRWSGRTPGPDATPRFTIAPDPFPRDAAHGWTLAAAAGTLGGPAALRDGSVLPDLYVANDFGPDYLFVNRSAPGHVRFTTALGRRIPGAPKSKVLGHDSFKGMGIDFGDLNGDGKNDMVVSNIATSFGLQESNFAWIDTSPGPSRLRADLTRGVADFTDKSRPMGLAQTGWSWDVKIGDFANRGSPDIVQTNGFVKGTTNRWPQLQELAMTNDNLLADPAYWPNVEAGDDIAGRQCLAFRTVGRDGRFVDIGHRLGLCVRTPTRGIATAATRGDGALDFAVARQWGPPAFYQNDSARLGRYLDLRLYLPATGAGTTAGSPGERQGGLRAAGTPAIGASAVVRTAAGKTLVGQVDGGGGHSGKRDFGLHFGLGDAGPATAVTVTLTWRDLGGVVRSATRRLTPGTHRLLLGQQVQEVQEVPSS